MQFFSLLSTKIDNFTQQHVALVFLNDFYFLYPSLSRSFNVKAIEMLKKFFFIHPGNVISKNINKGKQLILNEVQIIKTGS